MPRRAFVQTRIYPGIEDTVRTQCWISRACDPSIWPDVDDLSAIPEETVLPGGEIIRFVAFPAIWDTGVSLYATIPQRVIDECRLDPVGKANIQMPVGRIAPYQSELYRVNIGLPNGAIIRAAMAVRAQEASGQHVIIGMGVITLGDFSITNKNGKTVFSFRIPSLASTDFTEESGGSRIVLAARIA
jgi:predicted aspartyl protease